MSQGPCLALLPRDGVFSKDARGWYSSESGRGHALDWPWPSTLLGALRGAWGRVHEARLGQALVGDAWRQTEAITLRQSLVLRRSFGASWGPEHRVWPVPADSFWPEAEGGQVEGTVNVQRLEPWPADGVQTLGHDDDGCRAALWQVRPPSRAKPGARPTWWRDDDFIAWLAGQSVAPRPKRAWLTLARRTQTHVRLQRETLTAEDGMLFSHEVVETLDRERVDGHDGGGAGGTGGAGAEGDAGARRNVEWGMGVAIGLRAGGPFFDTPPPALVHFGSNGRVAPVEALPPELFEPPPKLRQAFRTPSRGVRLVIANAACFREGWLPDGLTRQGEAFRGRLSGLDVELVLRAALIARPLHASGWDMLAGRPKPVARLVPPGSVYFFERVDGRPFDETLARALWLHSVGERTDEGFGRVVPGTWNPSRGLRRDEYESVSNARVVSAARGRRPRRRHRRFAHRPHEGERPAFRAGFFHQGGVARRLRRANGRGRRAGRRRPQER